MNLFRAIATVGAMTMISRVLGFARDILIAAMIGPGLIGDAFFVAFKIPNLFRRLFAEGAFAAGFVPIFSELAGAQGRDAAREFAAQSLAVLVVVLVVLVALFEIAMPWLMMGLAPGFVGDPEKFDLAVTLTRITFPYLLFISVVSLLGGVLNSLGKFAAAAATPILLNLALIGALIGLADIAPTAGHALAWGVAGAGVLQLVWLWVATARAGMALGLRRPKMTVKLRELARLMLPAVVGSGVAQINIAVDIIIASLLATGSISYLFFADRLTQLPLGVIGVAVGTALLPLLSRQLAAGDCDGAANSLNRAVETALVLALPAAAALMIVAEPVVRVLFERGAFDAVATNATALAVVAYASGVPAYVMVKVLSPGFFARKDTKTPVRIAIVALVVNIVLNLALMGPMGHVGLALATAIAAWLNAGLLAWMLVRRGHWLADDRLRQRLPQGVLATGGLAVGLWLAVRWLAEPLAGSGVERIGTLAAVVAGGLVFYAALAHMLGVIKFGEIRALARRGS
jgi:putative peptidoglycan lipid II flippase